MNKPDYFLQGIKVIDLLNLLDYIDLTVVGFKDIMWDDLCNSTNLSNDVCLQIDFADRLYELSFEEDKDDDDKIKERGLELMLTEFEDIKNGNVIFSVCW